MLFGSEDYLVGFWLPLNVRTYDPRPLAQEQRHCLSLAEEKKARRLQRVASDMVPFIHCRRMERSRAHEPSLALRSPTLWEMRLDGFNSSLLPLRHIAASQTAHTWRCGAKCAVCTMPKASALLHLYSLYLRNYHASL